jgi:hypothetical protein
MPKRFVEDAPSLTVSDVLSLFLCNDTNTVLLKLDRFFNKMTFAILLHKTFYLIWDLTLAKRFREKSVVKA